MKRHVIAAGLLAIQLFTACFLLVDAHPAEAQEILLIGNTNVPDTLKAEEVRQIFLGKKTRWADDSHIYFALYTLKDVYGAFVKRYTGKTWSQYRNYWKKQVFSGKGRMPKSFKTLDELLEYLAETEGAIGFMPLQELERDAVKILSIE